MDEFDDWFYEVENFGLRCERAFDEIGCVNEHEADAVIKWLKAAWEMGAKSND